MSEFVNQWVGGMERLRWAHMESPCAPPKAARREYPRSASQSTLAAWAATWQGLRSVTVQRQRRSPAPGTAPVPLATYLRGKGPELAGRQATASCAESGRIHGAGATRWVRGKAAIQQAARDLAALKFSGRI